MVGVQSPLGQMRALLSRTSFPALSQVRAKKRNLCEFEPQPLFYLRYHAKRGVRQVPAAPCCPSLHTNCRLCLPRPNSNPLAEDHIGGYPFSPSVVPLGQLDKPIFSHLLANCNLCSGPDASGGLVRAIPSGPAPPPHLILHFPSFSHTVWGLIPKAIPCPS